MLRFIISALLIGTMSVVSGFGVVSSRAIAQHRFTSRDARSMKLFAIRCEDKYYQLEEMEDKENCTTELYLKGDRTVEFGDTDGPIWTEAVGSWQVKPGTNDFTMVIKRKYQTGRDGTDMGSFDFQTERTFSGEMTQVGACVGITGVVHEADNGSPLQEEEIGFFNMIDATDERLKNSGGDEKLGKSATSY
ncbi:predicted protein [Phaeodactylum tricornutum CCAP 1055/1]|uniref:Jacalin-type lectin domain-containing protein n=2 Tax=Phaeodactylum tricornutum TaxID=2850 RepID=B7G522_PHATC|nr:predicted protein [Phaeodactylum tricornutum CCAP 1055/1]EEC46241.1 predicted protein [Phaeodactylum tricornutum CCAP 1055/1]|eukprot:XP_002182340.1 predicted protein [Phaeodactylum tricornutum CCAP 1055/1]